MTTPSPAPQWAKDAAIDYLGNPGGSMTDEDTMYHQCDIDDLAAIITKHATAISEENRRLREAMAALWGFTGVQHLLAINNPTGQIKAKVVALLAAHPALTAALNQEKKP